MKAWYDDIDSATLQRIKTYSAFNDATSKNLMVQTMYEYREKEIQDFKETNHELAETCIARKKRIADLEKENKELKTVKILQLERKIASIRGAHSVDCRKLNARTEQVERLKKENAELKTKVTALENANKAMVKELDDMTSGGISFLTNVVRSKEEIDKAKEHIENLLYYVKQCTCERSNYAEIENDIKEAEQFLKEVSE